MKTKSDKKKVPKKKEQKKSGFFYRIKKWFRKTKKNIVGDSREPVEDFSIIEVILIIIISILFGVVVGYIITYSNSPFKRNNHTPLEEITDTYQSIVDNYYGDLDEKKLSDAAIKGMISSLNDPYSSYMNESLTDDFNETVDGTFVGIGATVTFSPEGNKVIELFEDSPAGKAGIQVGDMIVRVDGEDISSLKGDEVVSRIKGKKGTKVTITVIRDEEEKEFVVTRDTIELILVHKEIFDRDEKKIGYIKIDAFAATTFKQFKKALLELEKDKIDSLIIDVRDNPGGHLLQTRQILSMFFSKKTVLYQVESRQSKQKIKSDSDDVRNYPVAVLINNASASASEVVASCFQENYKKAIIVGVHSYGKGTVQQSQELKNGTSIKYTTQKWLTSKGEWLHEKGVEPDVVVELGEAYYQNPVYEEDNQLQEALNQLLNKMKESD